MKHLKFHGPIASILQSVKQIQRNKVIVVLSLLIGVTVLLASCGSTATGQARPVTSTPTLASSPATLATPKPTPKPTIAAQPTTQPAAAPAILDLRPSSMSIVGHLDCQKNGTFICFARVLSSSSNQSNLHWSAFTNIPGNIGFSPSSGVLAPGQSALVTITVPFTACTPGLFSFQGPVNTHTITWAC